MDVVRMRSDVCHGCGFVVRAMTQKALEAASREHQTYVNSQLDRTTDRHFEIQRLDRLITDGH